MKKVLKILMGVIFAALLIGTFIFLWNKTRPIKVTYDIVMPAIDTIEKSAVATGKVEPRDEVLIKPQISGIISDLYHEAGQMVRQGDVIAKVKVIPDMGALSSAQARLTLSKINRDQAERDFDRVKQLYEAKVMSRDEFEKSELALNQAREEVQTAQDNFEIVQNGIASRNSEFNNTQIRSTVTGMILDIPVKVGNSVIMSNTFNDGTTIASVADLGNMIFRGKMDETEVGKLKEGMPVEITIGALQDVKLAATLEYIAPKGVEENGVVMFEIKAATAIPPELFVRAGYSANANIVIDSRKGILTIPESAVEFENDKSYVYLLTGPEDASEPTFERKEVKLGLSNGLKVEITEGLSETDKIRGEKQNLLKKIEVKS